MIEPAGQLPEALASPAWECSNNETPGLLPDHVGLGWDVAGQQLLYSLIFFVLLFLYEHNRFAVDVLIGRSRSVQS